MRIASLKGRDICRAPAGSQLSWIRTGIGLIYSYSKKTAHPLRPSWTAPRMCRQMFRYSATFSDTRSPTCEVV